MPCSASPLALALPHVLRHASHLREAPSRCWPSGRASTGSRLAPWAATPAWLFVASRLAFYHLPALAGQQPCHPRYSAFKQPRAEWLAASPAVGYQNEQPAASFAVTPAVGDQNEPPAEPFIASPAVSYRNERPAASFAGPRSSCGSGSGCGSGCGGSSLPSWFGP